MKEFKGKVAVVTGAASGIGRAMAERFAEEGMKLVLADVEQGALAKTESEMRGEGAEVIAVRTDVSREADVLALAEKALDRFGRVHILCNNAGVGFPGNCWAISDADWRWVMGVNLWGVVYGIRHFLPPMFEHGEEGHVVNVSSMAGLTTGPGMAPYYVTKHGVVALSECLYKELQAQAAPIGVSVLCPGWVNTAIGESDRNRPSGPLADEDRTPAAAALQELFRKALKHGLPPKQVAQLVLEAIVNDTFYVLPHPHWKTAIEVRMRDILEQRSPTIQAPPDLVDA